MALRRWAVIVARVVTSFCSTTLYPSPLRPASLRILLNSPEDVFSLFILNSDFGSPFSVSLTDLVKATSSESTLSCLEPSDDFGLVKVKVADIRLAALPLFPPLNMSCLRFSALSAFVDLVPRTNCMASPEFDLPEPFGPVIAVNPDWNGMDTSPPNDLKLRTSILTNRIPQSPQSGFFSPLQTRSGSRRHYQH